MENLTHNQREQTIEASPQEALSLPSETLDATQNILALQLLGEDEYKIMNSYQRYDRDGNEITSPYAVQGNIDFSKEAIEKTAFELAAEVLPKEVVRDMHLEHDIPDNISYQKPPSLESVLLVIGAWEATGRDREMRNIIGKMSDFLGDRWMRDNINEALINAEDTGEPFTNHYNLVVSRETPAEREQNKRNQHLLARAALHDSGDLSYDPYRKDLVSPVNEEYHERLIQGNMIYHPAEAEYQQEIANFDAQAEQWHEQIEEKKKEQLAAYSKDEIRKLEREDQAQALSPEEMAALLND